MSARPSSNAARTATSTPGRTLDQDLQAMRALNASMSSSPIEDLDLPAPLPAHQPQHHVPNMLPPMPQASFRVTHAPYFLPSTPLPAASHHGSEEFNFNFDDDFWLPSLPPLNIQAPAQISQENVACFEAFDKLIKEHYTGPLPPSLINPAPAPSQPSQEDLSTLLIPQPTPLEFDPPPIHYAEPRGGLPIGYRWISPGSVEPVDPEFVPYVPEEDVDAEGETDHSAFEHTGLEVRRGKDGKRKLRWIEVTPEQIASMPPRKKWKKKENSKEVEEQLAGVQGQQREGSPASSVLSSAPSGLLTPDAL